MAKKKAGGNGRSKRKSPSTAAGSNGSNGEAGSTTNGVDADRVQFVSISQETRRRYLNYALSVVTSRALPDVRDGLKPVQRRILYAMFQDLRLHADGKPRKCARIVGETMGNYHPHGDQAIYDALVRMAQPFSMGEPLVDGQGNFGSIMGLPPAASRYTEARLTALAGQLMSELRFETVDTRANYDGSRDEPVVLPARFPNLLVNGTQGIAVGMATSIPPHNLGEVIKACIHLIKTPNATVKGLMRHIKGPDFPLGGRIVTDAEELITAYKEGRGAIKVRGEWEHDVHRKKPVPNRLVIRSIPYAVTTGGLMQELGDVAEGRKLAALLSAVDESDRKHGMRIVLEIKSGNDAESVMAYLYKHTTLEQNFSLNTTCLIPDDRGNTVPARLSLDEMLRHFLDFRFATVRRRFEYQLRQLERRIHILEGFAIIFEDLNKVLQMIRQSDGKRDAAARLMNAYPLDEDQTEAILELALYRISQLEIDKILEELEERRREADEIRKILKSDKKLWKVVETELAELGKEYAVPRRTKLGSAEEIAEFDPEHYIVRENTNVVVTREGWFKRVGNLKSVESTRVREGDEVLAVAPGNTADRVVLFSSDGTAYTIPIDQAPASSGYGDPVGKHVRLGDGAHIVAVVTTDPRFTPEDEDVRGNPTPAPYVLIATAHGQVMQISLSGFREPSTKNGRKYCRLRKGDRVVFVEFVDEAETMFLASKNARVLHFAIEEIPLLASAGKGVKGIKLEKGDEVLGAVQLARPSDSLRVVNTNDTQLTFGQQKYGVTSRGGKGVKTSQRNGFKRIIHPPIELVDWTEMDE